MRIRTACQWRLNTLRKEWRRAAEGDYGREYADWNYNCRWRRLCFAHDPQIGWRFLPGLRARLYHDGGFHVLRTNAAGWRADLALLEEQHRKLRDAVAALPARTLQRKVPNGATAEQSILGIAMHDVYHAAQIQLLKALRRSTT